MERLGGIDASFVFAETPAMHMHVCGLLVLDPATMDGGDPVARIHALAAARFPEIAALRRRLAPVPWNLGRPYWADDPAFDVERHLHRRTLARPDDRALAEVVGEIAATPLPRDRPLWELWVLEGLAGGRVAVVAKMHHSTVDGISGAKLMGSMLDLSPDAPLERPVRAPTPAPWPSGVALVQRSLRRALDEPVQIARLVPDTVGRLASALWHAVSGGDDAEDDGRPGLFSAPRTSFNATVSARRSVAFATVSLEDVKAVKRAFGVTVNDVVTAVVGGGLRRYLADRGELPERPLVGAEPVSAHGANLALEGNTKVSLLLAGLATDVEDPAERLRVVATATRAAKAAQRAVADHSLVQWIEHLWLGILPLGTRLYSGLHLADHHPVLCNVVLSNVPGPPVPLYMAGARLEAVYPLGPVVDGVGLNVTVLSQEDRLGFGIVACPDLVPDVWDVAGYFPTELDALVARLADGRLTV